MDIKIKTFLLENDNSYQGYMLGKIENNIITYQEENISVAIIIESDKITLTRESDDYNLKLIFIKDHETIGTYIVHEVNKEIDLKVKTSLLRLENNKLEIKYLISTKEEESYFRLEYEVLK